MERKLNKLELSLWKEITKDDKKMNEYLIEENLEKKGKRKKKDKSIKNYVALNESSRKISREKSLINKQKPQINKRMRTKFERGLIRPEAYLDLHGYKPLASTARGPAGIGRSSLCPEKMQQRPRRESNEKPASGI